jgi:hypothetical protein
VHNGDGVEIEQVKITGIHFLEHEDKRGKKADVAEQSGDCEKTDATFEFIEPGHVSEQGNGELCIFKVGAVHRTACKYKSGSGE